MRRFAKPGLLSPVGPDHPRASVITSTLALRPSSVVYLGATGLIAQAGRVFNQRTARGT